MTECELQSPEGLTILLLQIDDEDRREQAVHHIVNLLAEEIGPALYELITSDWDEDGWQEEVEWFTDLLEGTDDSLVVWRFTNASYSRFTLGGSG